MTDNAVVKQPILGNTSYDIAKDVVTLYIPGAGTLYSALAAIWDWGFSNEVVGTAAAVATFLGIILKVSSNRFQNLPVQYNGEVLINTTDPMEETMKLVVDEDFQSLQAKDEIRLKVTDTSGKGIPAIPDLPEEPEAPLHSSGL